MMTVKDRLFEAGHEDIQILESVYDRAFLGVTGNGRSVYDYDMMIDCIKTSGISYGEAKDWVDSVTLGALPYSPGKPPVILYRL